MRVYVDGRELELSAGATLADALGSSGAYIAPGAIIGVVKGRGEKSRQTNSYWLNTSKGKLRIELLESELLSIWHESVDRISGSTVRWSSADGVAFGPFLLRSLFPGTPRSTAAGRLCWGQPVLIGRTPRSSSSAEGIPQLMAPPRKGEFWAMWWAERTHWTVWRQAIE